MTSLQSLQWVPMELITFFMGAASAFIIIKYWKPLLGTITTLRKSYNESSSHTLRKLFSQSEQSSNKKEEPKFPAYQKETSHSPSTSSSDTTTCNLPFLKKTETSQNTLSAFDGIPPQFIAKLLQNISQSSLLVAYCDQNGNVLKSNEPFKMTLTKYFGTENNECYGENNIIYHNFSSFLFSQCSEEKECEIRRKLIEDGVCMHEISFHCQKSNYKKNKKLHFDALVFSLFHKGNYLFKEDYCFLIICKDMTEEKREKDFLVQNYERNQWISLVSEIAVWDWDRVNDEIYWSPNLGSLIYGIEKNPENITNELINSFVYEPDKEKVEEFMRKEHQSTFSIEYRTMWPNGETHYILSKGGTIKDEKGNTIRMISIVQDVTQRKKVMNEYKKSKLEAEKANQAKSVFLANVSHEIRTPMNCILGILQILMDQRKDFGEQNFQYLKMIKSSAESLLTLLGDVIDLSMIEAHEMKFEIIDTSIQDTVESVMELMAESAHAKGLQLESFVDVPILVKCDPQRVRQVVTNLVSNAIKFTRQGSIKVNCGIIEQDKQNVKLLFEVLDTGIGIAPENLNKIFTTFTQADSGTSRQYGGTGLGLSISKHLVSLMKGEIGVESEPGKGSRFWFTIVCDATNLSDPINHTRSLIFERENSGLKILALVELDLLAQKMSEMCSKIDKISLTLCNDIEDMLKQLDKAMLESKPYDLCIMLPNTMLKKTENRYGGIDSILKIVQSKYDIELMLLLPFSMKSLGLSTLKRKQCSEYLTFPVRENVLLSCLRRLLDRRKGKQRRSSLVSHPHITNNHLKLSSTGKKENQNITRAFQGFRVLIVEDNPVNQRVLAMILEKIGFGHITVANNGLEALDILQCVNQNEKLLETGFDIIMMDIMMPLLDGYACTMRIRKLECEFKKNPNSRLKINPRWDRIPIIAITANAMKGEREKCLKAGMDEYIDKPIKIPILKSITSRILISNNS